MGITRLKKILIDDLSRSFTTREISLVLNSIDPLLNINQLTGFPESTTIPRKDAAKTIVDHFYEINKFTILLDTYVYIAKHGFKGEKVEFHSSKEIVKEMDNCGYHYNPIVKRVVRKTDDQNNWGYLESGKSYNFAFISIDICGNSELVRKYELGLVRDSYSRFKKYVETLLEKRNGKIWSWEGDGGLVVFHMADFVNQAVLFAIDLLATMQNFNCTSNLIDEDIRIRMAINSGSAIYKSDCALIESDAISTVKEVEKKHTQPLSITVTKNTYQHINALIRKFFKPVEANGKELYKFMVNYWRESK